jgi:folate-dependent phosphoribosylglycinamide formyltransferase PurN
MFFKIMQYSSNSKIDLLAFTGYMKMLVNKWLNETNTLIQYITISLHTFISSELNQSQYR